MRRGNGEGSVFKLGGKRRKPWAVRVTVGWTPEGKQKVKYLSYHRTKPEAKEALRKYLVNPYDLDSTSITLLEVYNLWEPTAKIGEQTLKNYRSAFMNCPRLHNKPIRQIKVAEIQAALSELKPSRQKILKYTLKAVYQYAIINELIDKNIIDLISIQSEAAKVKVPFTLEEIEKLKAYNVHHLSNTLQILLYTGMRITELLEIETKNVYLEDRYMIGGKKTQAGQDRIIPIHDEIYDIIKKRYNPKNKYLIVNTSGRPVPYQSYMSTFWNPLRKNLNLEHSPHSTRHTFITYATKQNLDRFMIQKIVGHKSQDITDHYTHRNHQELIKEINKLQYK